MGYVSRTSRIGQRFSRLLITGVAEPPKVECLCDCGQVICVSTYNLDSGATKSCGCLRKDSNIIKNKKIALKNRELGLVDRDDDERARDSREAKAWRYDIYERDGYKCIRCGGGGSRLEAHHILAFTRFPEARFDVSNGVTLCDICHRLAEDSFHKTYGTRNFSGDDYYEWIKG